MLERIQAIIADALYLEPAEVTRNSNLVRDLGAESIDFLDIIFRLEKEFSVKLPRGDMEKKARGGLTDEEFAINGVLQAKGLERMRKMMPEIEADAFKPGLNLRELPSLFTVATFERLVNEQLNSASSEEGLSMGGAERLVTPT